MDRQTRSLLAHADHPVAAPLDDASVDRLLSRAVVRGDEHVIDLGCGEGAWLLRALRAHPDVTGEGVDLSAEALQRARRGAEEAGVARGGWHCARRRPRRSPPSGPATWC